MIMRTDGAERIAGFAGDLEDFEVTLGGLSESTVMRSSGFFLLIRVTR